MKKIFNRVIALGVVCSLVLLTACGKGKDKTKENSGGTDNHVVEAKGRYMEEEVPIPQKGGDAFAIKRLKDQTLRILTSDGIYQSEDKGDTWSKIETDVDETLFNGDGYSGINHAGFDEEGNVVVSKMNFVGEEPMASEYYYIDKDGKGRKLDLSIPALAFGGEGGVYTGSEEAKGELSMEGAEASSGEMMLGNMENQLTNIKLASNGDILGVDFNGDVHQVDGKTGEIKHTYSYSNGQGAMNVALYDNKVVNVLRDNTVEVFNLETYQPEGEELKVVNDFLSSKLSQNSTMYMGGSIEIKKGMKENTLLLCDQSGLYQYTLGGTVVEQIISGASTTLGNLESYLQGLEQVDDETFLTLFRDTTGKMKMIKYTYSEDVSAVATKEIKVYALEDSVTLRQAISKYQQMHSDTVVNLEIGLSDGQTVADALRVLNTNIMAGKGPDVLVMDGISLKNYVGKGILADLTDVVKDISESEKVFDKIVNTYKKDEKVYVVPTRFQIPMIAGEENVVEGIHDLNTLADQIVNLRNEKPEEETVLKLTTSKEFLKFLYEKYSTSLLKEDGDLDQEEVAKFIENAKKAYDANMQGVSQERIDEYKKYSEEFPGMASADSLGLNLAMGQKLEVENMSSMSSYNTLLSSLKLVGGTKKNMKAGEKNLFVPKLTLGINAKSENLAEAKSFVKELLSKDIQSMDLGEGFPVNKEAFDKVTVEQEGGMAQAGVVMENEEGKSVQLTIEWAKEEEISELKELVESLDMALKVDEVMEETVVKEGEKCLDGNQTIDEATTNILKTMKLYLAE